MRWAGNVAHMGRGEVYTGFWWGRPMHRWEDNMKMGLQVVGCVGHGLVQSGLEQGQVVGTCE